MTTLRLPQVQARVTVTEEQTVLEAALDAGVQFPHSCRSGRCGAGKSRLLSGEVMMREHSPFALDGAGRDSGYILACRAVPLTDVAVAWSSEQVVAGAQARIVALHTMAPEIYRLVLRPEEPIAFSPGQFFEIELAPGITRSYSVASEQGALHLEFHIRAIAGGRASGILARERELGDVVRVSGPFGSAIGAGGVAGPILAIAASTGHAPVQSILVSNEGRRVHLLSFARQRDGFYLKASSSERPRRTPALPTKRSRPAPSQGAYRHRLWLRRSNSSIAACSQGRSTSPGRRALLTRRRQ